MITNQVFTSTKLIQAMKKKVSLRHVRFHGSLDHATEEEMILHIDKAARLAIIKQILPLLYKFQISTGKLVEDL